MDNNVLSQKLSAEKLAGLNDEQKAIFCMLDEKDQAFFSTSFGAKDLPLALMKKAEIIKRNQANREKLEKIQATIAQAMDVEPNQEKADDILSAVGLAMAGGAAAVAVATDNSAFWQGVKPDDLIGPLQTEFNNKNTRIATTGSGNVVTATVMLMIEAHTPAYPNSGAGVPALTINLAAIGDGCEVKTSDLTSQGTFETIKAGGQKLLNLAEEAAGALGRAQHGLSSPSDMLETANHVFTQGANLADIAGNLKLKERAWKAIKQTAEAIESNYKSEMEKQKAARSALEKAWNDYYHCPQCGVSFDGDVCRVCGTARPSQPLQPDPRQQ